MAITVWLLGCTLSIAAQLPAVRFYMDDGNIREYRMEDIEDIDFVSRTQNLVMRVYQKNEPEEVYPFTAIDNFFFSVDPPDIRLLHATIFGETIKYPVNKIDSIVFKPLEPKIAGCVVIINADNYDEIVSITEKSITIKRPSGLAESIKQGCMVVSEPIEQAPWGFTRKVTGISTEGNNMVVTTSEGSVGEIIEDGVVAFQVSFSPDEEELFIDVELNRVLDDPLSWYHLKFEKEVFKDVKFISELKMQPSIDFYMIIESFELKQFMFGVNTKGILELKVESELKSELLKYKKSLNDLFSIPPFELPAIKVMIGPVPFIITSSIDFQVGCDINLAAKVSATYTAESTNSFGLSYNPQREGDPWRYVFNTTPKFGLSPMQLSLGGSIKPFIGPQFNVNIFKVPEFFNLYAGMFSYLNLEVDVLNMPLWKLHGGIETAAGVESEWFEEMNYTVPVSLKEELLIAQAQNLITSVSPQKAAIGDTITIKGSWFGQGDGFADNLSFVTFKYGPSMLPYDMTFATNYVSWKDTLIEVVVPEVIPVPTDGNKEIEIDLLLNIQGYYNNWTKLIVAKRPFITNISPSTFKSGDLVTISGKGFGLFRRNNDSLFFNGVAAKDYTWWEDEMIIVKVPENIKSGVLWAVVNDFKSNDVSFTIVPEDDNGNGDIGDITVEHGTVKDIDGNEYKTVKIGEQWWMAENLKTKFGYWEYCFQHDTAYCELYGRLYKWGAAIEICPAGWHLPSDNEWQQLRNYLIDQYEQITYDNAGNVLKSKRQQESALGEPWATDEHPRWNSNTEGHYGSDNFGFSALPGGQVDASGNSFGLMGSTAIWWSSTERSENDAWVWYIEHNRGYLVRSYANKTIGWSPGLSIRCVRNAE